MPSIADVYVTILPETSRVADGIRRALRQVDSDMFRAGKRWGDEIKRGMGDADIDVDADTSKARRRVKDLDRDIEGRKRVVKIEHDKTSFGAAATAVRNLGTNFKSVAIVTAALPNSIASVSSSVAQLSGVMGLLPATIGAAALSFGSLKVATMGFGDAMKNIRDPEKFAESIGVLAPNMQEAAKSIQSILPEIDKLKFTVQDAFWGGMGEQIKQLSSSYLPMFQTAMSQVAQSANTALTTVSQMLQQPGMKMDMSQLLGNSTSAIDILSQALAPVVKAFTDIGLVGSGFLPQLATGATQAATAFATFVQNARQTGELKEWIQGGIDAMATLGRIAGDIFQIFKGFAGMDTVGGGLLGMIEGITSTVSDFVNSPAGSGAIQTFMTSLGTTVNALLPVLSSFLQTISPLLAGLGGVAMVILQSLAPGLNAWLQAMQPVVQAIMSGLTPVLAALQPVLTQTANILAGQMISGIQQLLPFVGPLVDQFAQLMIAVMPLLPQLAQIATVLSGVFVQALQIILPLLTTFAGMLTEQANRVVPLMSTQVGVLASAFGGISTAVQQVSNIVGPILDALKAKIDSFLNGPLGSLARVAGNLAQGPLARIIGGGAPTAPPGVVSATPWGSGPSTPLPGLGMPSAGGAGGNNRTSRTPVFSSGNRLGGNPALAGPSTPSSPAWGSYPAAPIPAVSAYTMPAPVASGGGGGGGGGAIDSDAKLLANVPAGSYSQDPSRDLYKGLSDCSSSIGDLINTIDGVSSTSDTNLTTGNAATWLPAHGFVRGSMPGAFNVGYNSGHMQATLPGGTPWNYGSDAAAARGGVGGTGAEDPAFTDHWYRPMSGGAPVAAGYPDTAGYASDKTLRDAQQKVDDKARAEQVAMSALEDFNAKGGGTAKQKEAVEYALARAKREHADAINDLATAQGKYNEAAGKSPDGQNGMGASFGQDLMGGIAEFFGFDGSLFKNPADFGLMKFLGAASKIKYNPKGGDGASLPQMGDGGGGGGLSGLLSFVPQAFGALNTATPFQPEMPTDNNVSPFGQTGPAGAAGPGNVTNVDAGVTVINPIGSDHLQETFETADRAKYPNVRQQTRHLPS